MELQRLTPPYWLTVLPIHSCPSIGRVAHQSCPRFFKLEYHKKTVNRHSCPKMSIVAQGFRTDFIVMDFGSTKVTIFDLRSWMACLNRVVWWNCKDLSHLNRLQCCPSIVAQTWRLLPLHSCPCIGRVSHHRSPRILKLGYQKRPVIRHSCPKTSIVAQGF